MQEKKGSVGIAGGIKLTDEYKKHFQEGLEYQDFIKDLLIKELGLPLTTYTSKKYQLKGENKQGIEIKYNSKYTEYKCCYFEIAEKAKKENSRYIDSGIYRLDSWLFVCGDYNTIFIFGTKFLRQLFEAKNYEIKIKPTSRGFVLKEADLNKYCLKKIEIKKDL